MFNIILTTVIFSVIVTIYLIFKILKKFDSYAERVSAILLILMLDVILILYIFDILNVPSELGINVNINTENWFNLINGIVGAAVAALVSINVVLYQLRKDNENNEKRDQENLRIQNIPLLKYEIKTDGERDKNQDNIDSLIISNLEPEKSIPYELYINIKNIGLNTIKSIIINLESSVLSHECIIIGENSMLSIEKDETIKIYRYINLYSNKEYDMKLKVFYEDLLKNWYEQEIIIKYDATKYNNGSKQLGNVTYSVKEENLIKQ